MILSDRIVVMNSGHIEQIGEPREVYQRPRSKFVSEFIGTTNFIPGLVEDIVSGSDTGHDLDYPDRYLMIKSKTLNNVIYCRAAGSDLRKGDRVIVSVRPEHISVSGERGRDRPNVYEGKVMLSAYIGNHIELEILVADQLLRTTTNPTQEFKAGSSVWIELNREALVPLPREVSILSQQNP